MKLLVVSDAWEPQTNGVVTTLKQVNAELVKRGLDVTVIHPGLFKTLPLPGYAEIRIAIDPWRIGRMIRAERPDTIHIATEGPLGLAARLFLARRSIPFSTSLDMPVRRWAIGSCSKNTSASSNPRLGTTSLARLVTSWTDHSPIESLAN